MDLQALQDELKNDPAKLGYAALIKNEQDADLLALLTKPRFAGDPYISVDLLITILANALAMPALERARDNAELPRQIRDYCGQLLWCLTVGKPAMIRLNNPNLQAGSAAVVQAKVLDQAVIDVINAAGSSTMQSRAEIVPGLAGVTLGDISFVLRGVR